MNFLKEIIKLFFSSIFSISLLNRLKQNKVWRQILKEKKPLIVSNAIGKLPHKLYTEKVRSIVWDKVPEFIKKDKDILYIEFGVWEGYSINYFSKLYNNSQAEFCGFDTFTGMPENWMHMKAGHYDKIGQAPVSNDSRVKFFKGMFQDTLEPFLKQLSENSKNKTVIINFDAVLHSSTIFCLFKIEEYFKNYYFLFDQFGSDECRAFQDFVDAKRKKYELHLVSKTNYGAEVLFGKFTG
jgi:hypothetical protein